MVSLLPFICLLVVHVYVSTYEIVNSNFSVSRRPPETKCSKLEKQRGFWRFRPRGPIEADGGHCHCSLTLQSLREFLDISRRWTVLVNLFTSVLSKCLYHMSTPSSVSHFIQNTIFPILLSRFLFCSLYKLRLLSKKMIITFYILIWFHVSFASYSGVLDTLIF